jgi:hypothetical protein
MECDDGLRLSSRVYGGRDDGVMGSLAAQRVAQSDRAGVREAFIVHLFPGVAMRSARPVCCLSVTLDWKFQNHFAIRGNSHSFSPKCTLMVHVVHAVHVAHPGRSGAQSAMASPLIRLHGRVPWPSGASRSAWPRIGELHHVQRFSVQCVRKVL